MTILEAPLSANTLWPQEQLESVERCPVCQSSARKLLHDALQDRVFFCAPGRWTLYGCNNCGAGYLDPRPTPESIGLAYQRYFTHQINGGRDNGDLKLVRRWRRALANGYKNKQFGIQRQPNNPLGYWIVRLFPKQRAQLDVLARHLPKPIPGQRLLDVGCGNGEFLAFATELGWQTEGLDFDPDAVRVARKRGLVVHQGNIEALGGRSQYYDAITLSHVIEHVHKPIAMLSRCRSLLKPGGLLWLETPNLTSAGYARYGQAWLGLDPPRHLVLFTWSSLRSALNRAGFAEIQVAPPRSAMRIFAASAAIRMGKDPYQYPDRSLRVRLHALWADYKARRAPEWREVITLIVKK